MAGAVFLQELQPLGGQVGRDERHAGDVAARPRQAPDQPGLNRINDSPTRRSGSWKSPI
jgi:hypothetical protein